MTNNKKLRQKSYKAALATTMAAGALVATVPATADVVGAETIKFSDVKENQHFYKNLQDLAARGVITGYEDGTFKPGANLTRAHAAKIIALALDLDTKNVKDPGFKDVSKSSAYYGHIAALVEAGVIKGYDDKTFKPNGTVTRAHIAQMIVKAFDLKEVKLANLPFKDINDKQWFANYVHTLYASEITTGKTTTAFGPNDLVTRGQIVSFIARAEEKVNELDVKPDFELSLIHTNDTHAAIANAPKRSTIIKNVRKEKPNALLLDAGDVFQGTLYFTEYKGEADLALMNYMGYDAMTLGNHEFDLGKTAEGHQALADFVKNAKFPILTSNVNFSQDDKLAGLYKAGIKENAAGGNIYDGSIIEVDGEKVGIFGLTTETTAGSSSPNKVTFENYIEEAEKAVAAFEAQGVDKIVALSHLGYNNPVDSNDLLLAATVDGIDVIVGGHSHTELKEATIVDKNKNGVKKDPTVIVQTGSSSANVGTLDVEFDKNGVVIGYANELIKIADQKDDPEAAAILAPYTIGISAVQNQETGGVAVNALPNPRVDKDGNGESVRNSETALGNLVADSMLAQGKLVSPNATIALQNGGGVRGPVDQGPITMGDVLTVLSFNNGLYSVDLTGAELKKVIEGGVYSVPVESGSFLHVAGLKAEFDSSKPAGKRVVSIQVADKDGKFAPVDDTKTYTVITNSYIAGGPDFSSAAEAGRAKDIGISDWESFATYLKTAGKVNPTIEGRIVDVKK